LLTIAGQSGMIVKHYDIEAAFLNGDISHEVYMKQPEGFEDSPISLWHFIEGHMPFPTRYSIVRTLVFELREKLQKADSAPWRNRK